MTLVLGGVGEVRLLEVAGAGSTPGKGTFWTESHLVRFPESIARGTKQDGSPCKDNTPEEETAGDGGVRGMYASLWLKPQSGS